MNRVVTYALVLGLGIVFGNVGCDGGATANTPPDASTKQPIGTVAIIDLAQVAKELGKADEITKTIQDKQKELEATLKDLRTRLNTEIGDKVKAFGPTPTEEQKKEVVKAQMMAQKRVQDATNAAKRKVTELQNNLMQSFRKEVGPVAMQIAKARGIGVVMIQSPSILAFDKATDISNDVITTMKPAKQ